MYMHIHKYAHIKYATAVTCRSNSALHRSGFLVCFFPLPEKSTSLQIDESEKQKAASFSVLNYVCMDFLPRITSKGFVNEDSAKTKQRLLWASRQHTDSREESSVWVKMTNAKRPRCHRGHSESTSVVGKEETQSPDEIWKVLLLSFQQEQLQRLNICNWLHTKTPNDDDDDDEHETQPSCEKHTVLTVSVKTQACRWQCANLIRTKPSLHLIVS